MDSLLLFFNGMLSYRLPVKLWLACLLSANMAAPLLFLPVPEAVMTLAALSASMILMVWLTSLTGFSRLLGVGHIFWAPLVIWLWTRLDHNPPDTALGQWIRVLMVANTVSLVIDAVDAVRYMRGERGEAVGLEPGHLA